MKEPLHLVHVFSTFAPGGPQVRTVEVMNALGGRFSHTVIAMDGRTDCAARVDRNVDFRCLPLELDPRSRLFPLKMIRRLRSLRPDLLLTYNWGAIESVLAAVLGRVASVVHHEEGFRPDEAEGDQKWRRAAARRLLLRRRSIRAVVVPSLRLKAIAIDVWRLGSDRVEYIPNAVESERFRPGDNPSLRAELGVNRGDIVVGSVAHLTPIKDVGYLLRAFAGSGLKDRAQLVVVGDGPERADLEHTAQELALGDRVRFVGRTADTAPYYRAFDLLAVSSRSEQMPVVVLEAMSSGLPVVATDVGDIATMVGDENRGFVVGRNDPALYAARLRSLVEDPKARKRLGRENRDRCVAVYDRPAMFDAYLRVYEKAMDRTNSGGKDR